MSKLAVIRISGKVGLDKPIIDTLDMLKLSKKFTCVVIEDNAVNRGMLHKVKDFTTWGTISDDTLKQFESKKKGKVVHLHPPVGGFERKGTKKSFNEGGVLGPRAEKINDLLARMM